MVKDTYIYILFKQENIIVAELRKHGNTGKIIRILVAYHQLESSRHM